MSDEDLLVNIRGTAEDLRRAARESVRELKDVGQEARRQTAQGALLQGQNRRTARSFDEVGDEARGAALSMAFYNREAETVRIRSHGVSQGLRDVGVNLRAIGWGTALANVGPLSAGLFDAAAGATAFGTALAPLAGTVAVLPSLFGAAGQAQVVWALATNKMKEALNGNEDALAALDPLQRQFVDRIRNELAPEIQKLQGIAQDGLLPGVSEAFTDVLELAPEVEKVLGRTSRVMGDLARDTGQWLSQPGVQKDLKTFGLENADVLDKLGHAALDGADGLRHVTMAAEPLVDHLTDLAREGAKAFDVWAEGARENGDLEDFFDLTSTRVDQSLKIAGDFAGIFGSLVSGSRPLADSMMSGLVRDADHLHDLVSSPQGQAGLKKFFDDAREPLGAVKDLLGDVVVDIGDLAIDNQGNLTNLADTLREDVLPPVKDVADILTDALPHAIDLVGDLGDLGSAVLPGLEPVADAVGGIADGLGEVIDNTTEITNELPGLAKLVPAITIGAGALGGWRLIKDVMNGTRGRNGKLGGVLDIVFGKGGLGANPTNPMWVAVVNGTGLPGVGSGKGPTVVPGGGKAPGPVGGLKPGERVSPGGVVLPPGARVNPPAPKGPSLGRQLGEVGKGVANMALPLSLTAYAFQTATQPYMPTLAGGAGLISQIDQQSTSTRRKIQDVTKEIDKLRKQASTGQAKQYGGGPGGLLDPAVGKAVQDLEKYRDRLVDAQKALTPMVYSVEQLKKAGDTKGLASQADQARLIASRFPEASAEITRFANQVQAAAERTVKPQFRAMKDTAGESLTTIERVSDQTSKQIARKLGDNTSAGKDALAHNFELAAKAIAASMQQGEVSTKQGLAAIEGLMRKALAQYGITGKQASRYLSGQDTVGAGGKIGTGNEGHAGITYNAAGGLHPGLNQLGRPGAPGRDSIPMMLNGRPVMAAEGETVAVLNRHQRAGLDRLAGPGGLAGFIHRNPKPNYMASGGIVEAAGGLQLPANFSDRYPRTHDTDGLPGYPATDVFGAPGTPVMSPVDGVVTKLSGQAGGPGGGGAFGYSIYIDGSNGESYYLTHFGSRSVSSGQRVKRGQVIGTIADYPDRADHIHEGIHGGLTGPMPSTGGGGAGSVAAITVPELKRVMFGSGLGALSALGQAGLDAVRAGAQQRLAQALGGAQGASAGTGAYRGPLNRVFKPGETISEQQARQLLDAGGMPFMPLWIPERESGLQPGIIGDDAAKGYGNTFGYGLLQNTTVVNGPAFEKVVQSLGGWGQQLNPVKNIAAAKWLSAHAASPLAPWGAAAGLLLDMSFAAGGLDLGDVVSLGDPKAPDKSKTKKSTAAAKRPKTSGPGRPDLGKVKPRKTAAAKKVKPVPQWIQDLLNAERNPLVPDYEQLLGSPIQHLRSLISNQQGIDGLTQEQATVTLYDSAKYKDLSNWLGAHPEDLADTKTAAEFIQKYGNGLEVVNQDGMNVQGQFVRGISQRVAEIQKVLGMYTDTADGSGAGGLLGSIVAYQQAMTIGGPGTLNLADATAASYIKQLRAARDMRRGDLDQEKAKLTQLKQRGSTVDGRIGLLQAQQDRLRQYKEDIAKAAIGHRLTDEGQRNRQWATDKISDLGDEIQQLNAEYAGDPDARLLPDMPVKPQGKAATRSAMKEYRAALAKWQRRNQRYNRALDKSASAVDLDQRTLQTINQALPGWTARRDAISDKRGEYAGKLQQLTDDDLPAERLNVSTLQGELADLLGTRITPQPLSADTSTDNGELADLLKQQRDEARQNLAVSQAQYDVLRGIAPLVGQRILGSYAQGTGLGYVPETGPYLLHRGETVNPDPQGGYGSQLAAGGSSDRPVQVEVHLHGDTAGLIKRIDARIDGVAARVVDAQLGRKGRLISVAPGGR